MKKCILTTVIMVLCMAWSFTVYASGQYSETYDNSKEYGTLCYSKKDSNSKKNSFSKMSKSKLKNQYLNHKIWTLGITVSQSGNKCTVKWKKTPGASGYQIAYSKDVESCKLVDSKKMSTKKKKIVINEYNDGETVFVQVRPYKIINGRKIYGKWSSVFAYGYIGDAAIRDDNIISSVNCN